MAANCYFELRKSTRSEGSIAADTMRHLSTRQHLGKTVIICHQPSIMLSAARKQWLKLSRLLQKERSSTLNADKILKYTHAVTRMQRMYFSAKTPFERPEADVYFLAPEAAGMLPLNCWTVYLHCSLDMEAAAGIVSQLPEEALIVDYVLSTDWKRLGIKPKKSLETKVRIRWQEVQSLLAAYHIDINSLILDDSYDVENMDDALDTLLGGHAHEFMLAANNFQRALELARPLRLPKSVRIAYDSLILLAHRVQALMPGAFSKQFLEVYDEDDTFFLYDNTRKRLLGTETLAQAFTRHTEAGRHHLARSLRVLAEST
jgi:hypothetical protein